MGAADVRLKVVRSNVHNKKLVGQNDLTVNGNIAHCGERVICAAESVDLRYCNEIAINRLVVDFADV